MRLSVGALTRRWWWSRIFLQRPIYRRFISVRIAATKIMDSNRWNFLFLVKPCSSAESTLTYYKWGWPPGWLYYIRPNKKIYWFSSNANEPKADKLEVSRKMILPLTRHASILCLGSSWSQEVMSSNPGTGFFYISLQWKLHCFGKDKIKLYNHWETVR